MLQMRTNFLPSIWVSLLTPFAADSPGSFDSERWVGGPPPRRLTSQDCKDNQVERHKVRRQMLLGNVARRPEGRDGLLGSRKSKKLLDWGNCMTTQHKRCAAARGSQPPKPASWPMPLKLFLPPGAALHMPPPAPKRSWPSP